MHVDSMPKMKIRIGVSYKCHFMRTVREKKRCSYIYLFIYFFYEIRLRLLQIESKTKL